jgi:hypothetical protein
MAEVWSNDAKTTLLLAIGPSDTTLTVVDPSKFPGTGNFRLRVGTSKNYEYMMVTGVAGAVFTLTRAIEGSAAVAHAVGEPVAHVLTAGSVAAIASGTSLTGGTVSVGLDAGKGSTPAAGVSLYISTDTGNWYANNAGAWLMVFSPAT